MFHPDSAGFNPILVVNTILNLPLYLEVKQAPTPTNDVAFTIGKDSLRVDLGRAAELVPEDQFGISGSSRPLDFGIDIKGVRFGVAGGVRDQGQFQLGGTLLPFPHDSPPPPDNNTDHAALPRPVGGGVAPT